MGEEQKDKRRRRGGRKGTRDGLSVILLIFSHEGNSKGQMSFHGKIPYPTYCEGLSRSRGPRERERERERERQWCFVTSEGT